MARFEVVERHGPGGTQARYAVVDTRHGDMPVAEFEDRDDAEAHARRLEQGPFDWDRQEQWREDWGWSR